MKSPLAKIIKRGCDPKGCGHFEAPRGSKLHKGFDIVSIADESVVSMIDGVVTKIGYPYQRALQFRYVEVSNEEYRIRLMYVEPTKGLKVGDYVCSGDRVGYAQNISGYWKGGMKNHVHIEIYKKGNLVDPEPYLNQIIQDEEDH